MNNNSSKYNSFGVLDGVKNQDIKQGDVVEYIDTKRKDNKAIKISLIGIWDGDKVCFDDKEETIVRTTVCLKKLRDVINIGDKVKDKDNKICTVIGTTKSSVNIFINKKTNQGVDCSNWFSNDNFEKRFKKI
jgi:hypothetical protein